MRIKELTMKNGDYFRLRIEDANEEWWDAVVRAGEFESKAEMFDTGYSGMIEIEGYFENDTTDEVTVVYFFDKYEQVDIALSKQELESIEAFVKSHWNSLPDNAELLLGDEEWYEKAYKK